VNAVPDSVALRVPDGPDLVARRVATGKPRRRLAWRLHSLFGLKLSLFLAFVCLTGTVATVSHEVEWLLLPEVRASGPVATDADWGLMWESARAAYPEGWVRSVGPFDRSDASYFGKAAAVALPDGREITVMVDPATARVTGELSGVTFHSFMRGLHYYLFAPGDWGFYLVTALGFVLAGSLVTGVLVYKRFWRGLAKRPRFGRDMRTWLGDLHRLAGVWSIPFVALISTTGMWYLVERVGVDWETPPPEARALRVQPDARTVEAWVAKARAAMPGLSITGVSLPWSDGEPVTVQGEWRAWLVRERTNAAYIDPSTGELLGLRVAHQLSATERWVHTADPLHFGNFAGVAGKLVWVAFGLVLTGLAASGAVINGRRLAGIKQPGIAGSWWRGLGLAMLPSLLLILAVPAWFYRGWDSGAGVAATPAGVVEAGGRPFRLWRTPEGWCASTTGRPPATLAFGLGGYVTKASFDAGRFCASAPASLASSQVARIARLSDRAVAAK
jgi:uncharacterized iron-regulated membrane protein